jgi:hypothetical protein
MTTCRNLNLGLATKARAYKGAGQEWNPIVAFHALESLGKCEGNEPHIPKWAPTLGIGVPNLHRAIAGVKTHWIEKFLISLEKSIRM